MFQAFDTDVKFPSLYITYMRIIHLKNSLQCVERSLMPNAIISSTTHNGHNSNI